MPGIRRSADQHPELGLPEVRKLCQTEGLFSDHYLKKRILGNSWWPTDAEAKSIWLPLEAEIVFTDRMIDQIVYPLYGLTTDEIKIVEGAN
jgi:hypothetical protein